MKNKLNDMLNFLRSIIESLFNKEISIEERKKVIFNQFVDHAGYEPCIDDPVTFNEKIQWYKLYYRDFLMKKCSDKYAVRNYVKENIGEKYLNEIIGVYDKVEDIDFNSLPDKFVLKVNHGCAQNIICKDKGKLDIRDAENKLNLWMRPEANHYFSSYEWGYRDIKPKIICEKYIEQLDGELFDYKFFCFNGNVHILYVSLDRGSKSGMKMDFFDMDWNKLPFIRKYENSQRNIKKPKNFEKMVELAEKLSKPFPFARVDFYELNNKIVFGEMTFYPGNGIEPFTPMEWDYKLGEMFQLPNKQEFSLRRELISKELKYGGLVNNISRNKVSIYDPRSEEDLKKGGMIGGDRMLHHNYAEKYSKYLKPFLNEKNVIVEVGILTGVGLAMWCDVFAKSRAIGLDIDLGHINNNMNNLLNLGAFKNNKPELY